MADKCIEIYIPGLEDGGIYFEGANGVSLFEIIDSITKNPSAENGLNLERLKSILTLMDEITQTSDLLSGDNFDPANIGDNIVGNASVLDLGKVLFRNNIENSTSLVPMFSLLSSNGFKISASNVILTSDPEVNNSIYLGNKYFKIVANPTKPNFLSYLYKSLGFAYVNMKIQNNGTIANVIESYLNQMSLSMTGDETFDNKLKEISELSHNHKLRAFLTYILDESNIPDTVKPIVDQMSIAIETDIEGHLQEHIKRVKAEREYGKTLYEQDKAFVGKSKASHERRLEELKQFRAISYYNSDYQADKALASEDWRGKRKTPEEKAMKLKAKDKVREFEAVLRRYPDLKNLEYDLSKKSEYEKEYQNLETLLDGIGEMESRTKIHEKITGIYNTNWNPYSLQTQNDYIEDLVKSDLKLEKIEPRTIKFGGETVSTLELRKFLQGYLTKPAGVFEAPEISDLVDILNESGIQPLDNTIPQNRAIRKFLAQKENLKFFKLFWNPNNYTDQGISIDSNTFEVRSLIEDIILNDTLYLPYEDYLSDYSFDLRGLTIQSSEESFKNNSLISRYRGDINNALENSVSVRFTAQKGSELKVKGSTLTVPMNGEFESLPKDIISYLQRNSIKKLHIDFDSNSNVSPARASESLRNVISLINNTPDVAIINRVIINGLNNIEIELAKTSADLGMYVQVFTDNQIKFEDVFANYNTKSFSNDLQYRFPTPDESYFNNFNSSTLESAYINREISGLLYDTDTNKMGNSIKMSKLMPGNTTIVQFPSGNKIQALVTRVIKFNPRELFLDSTESGKIEVGSKVKMLKRFANGNTKVLADEYYVIDVLSSGEYVLSNGFQVLENPVKPADVQFDLQAQIRTYNNITMFPVISDPSKFIRTKTGEIERINERMFKEMYSDVFSDMSNITGLSIDYLTALIKPGNAHNFGVIDTLPIESMNVNNTSGRQISKSETENILSVFADKLNMIFNGNTPFVNVINQEALQEEGLSSYEYQNPAFIKDGKIYLNIEHPGIHPGSLVHELSHLLLGSLRANNPDLYYNMLSKIDLESNKYNNFKVRYKNRLRSDIQEEILADLFSRYFDNEILDYGSLEEAFDNLSLNGIFKEMFDTAEVPAYISNNELMNMTINEAVTQTASGFAVTDNLFDNPRAFKLRLVSNLKEELYKDGKLEEICQ